MIDEKYIKIGQIFTGSPETTGSIYKNALKIIDIYKDKNTGREMLKVQEIEPKHNPPRLAVCEQNYFKRLALIPQEGEK